MAAIELEDVVKSFSMRSGGAGSFQDIFVDLFRGRKWRKEHQRDFDALKGVSFAIEYGEMVGVIGSNGSGKSTCLKLVSRIIEPTSGAIRVNGRVAALLELGAGFHPELSGRENVFLYGSVLGIKRSEMAKRFDSIVQFAELERFIDVPVKFYSSGMYIRLAFATAINVDAEILLVDEVLAVGDQRFQNKCLERISELKRAGVTIMFVTHNLADVRTMCDRAIWLDQGLLVDDGPAESVISAYLEHVYQMEEAADLEIRDALAADSHLGATAAFDDGLETEANDRLAGRGRGRWGSGEAEITDVRFMDAKGEDRLLLTSGEPASILFHYHAHEPIADPMFGFAIYRSDGTHIAGPNSVFAGMEIAQIEGHGIVRYEMESLPLLPGTYYLTVSLCDHSGVHTYDYRDYWYRFRVMAQQGRDHYGLVYIPASWSHAVDSSEEQA